MDDNGRFLKVVTNGKKKFVTVEKWKNTKEGRKNSIEGLAKELGVDRKVVIEALRRTGNYNGMSDAEIAKNLKVGETLVVKDGKVMTEAEAKGINWVEAAKNLAKAGAVVGGVGVFVTMRQFPLILSIGAGEVTILKNIVEYISGSGADKVKNQQLVEIMRENILGKPYVPAGGQSGPKPPACPAGVDCSGGIFWSLRYAMGYEGMGYLKDSKGNSYFNGWNVPLLLEYLPQKEISKDQLQPGNLIYVNYNSNWDGIDSPNDWDHIMMVSKIENGKVFVYSAGKYGTREISLSDFENWALRPEGEKNLTLTYNPVYKYTQINWQELWKRYRYKP
ncbi:MAG: hypothetical protein ACP5Q5_00015 [Brevinematia bacterium]